MAARYWLLQLVRAIVAAAAGVAITLDQQHTAAFGIDAFATFAIVGGVVVASFWFFADAAGRALWLIQGLVGIAAGIVTLVVHEGGLGALLYGVSVWALLTGALELLGGWRARRAAGAASAPEALAARDRVVVGAATVVIAIVYLVIPADNRLDVGLFGVYAIVLGVFLAIGALSLKWAKPGEAAPQNSESHA